MKTKSTLHRFLGVLLIATSAMSLQALAHDRDDFRPGHRMGHYRTYEHIYYPAYRSYYSPHSRTWFWLNGSRWYSGVRLPFSINMRVGGIPISLNSAIPYYQHQYVETHYAQPIYVIRHQERHGRSHYRERDEIDERRGGHEYRRW